MFVMLNVSALGCFSHGPILTTSTRNSVMLFSPSRQQDSNLHLLVPKTSAIPFRYASSKGIIANQGLSSNCTPSSQGQVRSTTFSPQPSESPDMKVSFSSLVRKQRT